MRKDETMLERTERLRKEMEKVQKAADELEEKFDLPFVQLTPEEREALELTEEQKEFTRNMQAFMEKNWDDLPVELKDYMEPFMRRARAQKYIRGLEMHIRMIAEEVLELRDESDEELSRMMEHILRSFDDQSEED